MRTQKSHLQSGFLRHIFYPDNRFKEISSFTPIKYKTPQKLMEAILAGKIKVTYHYPWAKDFLFKQLKSGMKETTF